MFICLSSGATSRYRRDIVRAIAMPKGARLQFRYRLTYVADAVKQKIRDGTYANTRVLIAYLDQSNRDQPPILVPCRFATIIAAQMHGSTTSLVFVLDEWAYSENIDAFNSQARSLSGGVLPERRSPEDEHAVGSFWFEIGDDALSNVISTDELGHWEKIVTQLSDHEDFKNESCFYVIRGLYSAGENKSIPMQCGRFQLKASTEYEMRIYHFLPRKGEKLVMLRIEAGLPLMALTTNSSLRIDSEYDMKRVRFRTKRPTFTEQGLLSVSREEEIRGKIEKELDFDMGIAVGGTWRFKVLLAIVIGALLAAPHVTSAISDGESSLVARTLIIVVSFVASVLAASVAVFNIKKDI